MGVDIGFLINIKNLSTIFKLRNLTQAVVLVYPKLVDGEGFEPPTPIASYWVTARGNANSANHPLY